MELMRASLDITMLKNNAELDYEILEDFINTIRSPHYYRALCYFMIVT